VDTLHVSGWKFSSFHDKMIDSSVLESMQEELCSGFTEFKMHIPPMIFGNDIMKVEKQQGFTLSMSARDALFAWSEQHSKSRMENSPLYIIQVPYAKDWVERSRPSHISASTREVPEAKDGCDTHDASTVNIDESVAHRAWDWTFSSDYCGTFTAIGRQPYVISMNGINTATVFDETFSASKGLHEDTESGIDMRMLRKTDVYDELILYQDDLEDCGEVIFDAKLRVMPQCWFLLARMFLRIDGVIVRIRESRYFHCFGAAQVHLEVLWKECALTEPDNLPYAVPTCNINPTDLRDPNKLSQVVPVVSRRYFNMEC
jgi:type 2A phosphatase activator TIP41